MGVLVDNGNQGIQTQLRGIQPKRKQCGGELPCEDVMRNQWIYAALTTWSNQSDFSGHDSSVLMA
jgi:hypothetical protein